MVSKISQDAAEAFMSGRDFKRGNTEVRNYGMTVGLSLYGTLIAIRYTEAEWFDVSTIYSSRTTLSRLNALPKVQLNFIRGVMYFCGEPIPPDEGFIRVYYNSVAIDFDKLGQILEG